jgi:cobalt/nickel transport system ATP-binding protein
MDSYSEAITIDNLSFRYPDGREALDGITMSVRRGESVALIGPNGAGKSTLLLHLNGILRSDGAVKILGKPVNDKDLKWLRGKVGLIFQNPDDQLFSPTVFDDIAFGPINMGYTETRVRTSVASALDMVGLPGYGKRAPHHLSTGEKKRIAIATVLAMDPEILAIDEPTANLDPRSKWSLICLLKSLASTQVIATHDLELVGALCSRTIILDRGKIMVDGATDIILADLALLEAHGLRGSRATI